MTITDEIAQSRDWTEVVQRFATAELAPQREALDAHPQDLALIRQLLLDIGKLGVYGSVIPPEYGGTGPSSMRLHEALDALGYRNAGLAMSCMPTYLTARALTLHGTEEQKHRWLEPIAAGKLVASWAVTEPHTGSDVANIRMRAERKGDEWVLNGQKMFITNASIADAVLVLLRTGGEGIAGQLTTFVIPMDLPGITVSKNLEKMGLRSSPTCEVNFEDVVVPDTDRLGDVGNGWQIGMDVLDYERLAIPAIGAGMVQRALDVSKEYAETREAFGRPIANHAPVAAMLAQMAANLLQLRLMYRHVSELVDHEGEAIAEASIGKLSGAKLAAEAIDLGVQIHGGYGYIREYEIEGLYRDVRLWSLGGGTSEIQRKIIAGQLGRIKDWSQRAGRAVGES